MGFFQPDEFFREWKLGEPLQLTTIVILPRLFPNPLERVVSIVCHWFTPDFEAAKDGVRSGAYFLANARSYVQCLNNGDHAVPFHRVPIIS